MEFAKTVKSLAAAIGEDHLDKKKLAEVEAEHADPIYLAPFLAYLATDAYRDITGQVFGLSASGKIEWYSNPAIVQEVDCGEGHWTMDALAETMPETILRAVRESKQADSWNKDISGEHPKTLFPLGVSVPKDRFHGASWVNMIQGLDNPHGTSVGTVTFAAGAHNDWHTHHGKQILMVTDGGGVYQERGKKARISTPATS